MTQSAARELLTDLFRHTDTVKAIGQALNEEIDDLVKRLRAAARRGNSTEVSLMEGQISGTERVLVVLGEYVKRNVAPE